MCSCNISYNIERNVDNNNIFISPKYPELKIQINTTLKYIGKFVEDDQTKTISGHMDLPQTKEYYLFIQLGDFDRVNRAVMITVNRLHRGYWLRDIFGRKKNFVYRQNIEIQGETYQQFTRPPHSNRKKKKNPDRNINRVIKTVTCIV